VPLDETTDVNGIAAIAIDASYAERRGKLIVEASGYQKYEQNINLEVAALPDVVHLRPEPVPTTLNDTPTPTSAASTPVALTTHHARYVTAMGDEGNWLLRQEPSLGECGWFTLQYLDDDKIALKTCYDKYVTASENGISDLDWALKQETSLSTCGEFTLYNLAGSKVAFKTCAGRYFTALHSDGQWLVIARTDQEWEWERFTLEQQ